MAEYTFVRSESLDDGAIARIMLNRPEARNAQNRGLLVELDDAFGRAEADDTVRVVILGGEGSMFSSGHDMGSKLSRAEWAPGPNQHLTRRTNGGTRPGAEGRMLQEWHYFFDNTRRWRNLRKITDVVGTRLGMGGVEYFAHPWELGPRKTKELMLTGDSLDVHEAHALGMVSKVFPAEELGERTLDAPPIVPAVKDQVRAASR